MTRFFDTDYVDGNRGSGFSWANEPHNSSSTRVASSVYADLSSVALFGDYYETVKDDGARLFYKLDETGGTSAADSSGNGFTGTLFNTPTLNQPGSRSFSAVPSMSFASGSSEYINTNNTLPTILGTATANVDFTLEAWAYPTTNTSTRLIIGCASSWTGIYQNATGWDFKVTDSAHAISTTISTTSTLAINTWYHLVGTFNATTKMMELWINGVIAGTSTFTGSDVTNDTIFLAGTGAANYFTGRIDNAAIYQKVLDGKTIKNHFSVARPEVTIVGWGRPKWGTKNLVRNGDIESGTNANFTDWTVATSTPFNGSFHLTHTSNTGTPAFFSSDFIPVNLFDEYYLSVMARYTGANVPTFYCGLATYNSSGTLIFPQHVYVGPELVTTTLTSPLSSGQTSCSVDNTVGWTANVSDWAAFDAKDDWSDIPNSNVLFVTGVSSSTLSFSAYSGPTIPAGAKIRRHRSGGSYLYTAASAVSLTTSYTKYSGVIQGISTPYEVSANKFRIGTTQIKILFLPNYNAANSQTTLVDDIWFSKATQRDVSRKYTFFGMSDTSNSGLYLGTPAEANLRDDYAWTVNDSSTSATISMSAQSPTEPDDIVLGAISVDTQGAVTGYYAVPTLDSYPEIVQEQGPVAYYRLNEYCMSTAYDDTTNHYDLTYTDTPVLAQESLIEATDDYSVDFNNAGSARGSYRAALASAKYSIEFSAKLKGLTGVETRIYDDYTASGVSGRMCKIDANTRVLDFQHATGSGVVTVSYTTELDVIHHYLITYDGVNLKLYVDGVFYNSVASGTFVAATSKGFNIGGSTASNCFKGYIDDLSLYNYARTPVQVWQNYSAANAVNIKKSTPFTLTPFDLKRVHIGSKGASEWFDGYIEKVLVYNRLLTLTELGQMYDEGYYPPYDAVVNVDFEELAAKVQSVTTKAPTIASDTAILEEGPNITDGVLSGPVARQVSWEVRTNG